MDQSRTTMNTERVETKGTLRMVRNIVERRRRKRMLQRNSHIVSSGANLKEILCAGKS